MKFSASRADCFCWIEPCYTLISYGNDGWFLQVFYRRDTFQVPRATWPELFHLMEKIALFVYTRGERWVIASRGPNQNRRNKKFSMFYGDTAPERLSQNPGGLGFEEGGEIGSSTVCEGTRAAAVWSRGWQMYRPVQSQHRVNSPTKDY